MLDELDELKRERRLMRAINRKLPEGQRIHKTRGRKADEQLGPYYIYDIYSSTFVAWRIDDLERCLAEA